MRTITPVDILSNGNTGSVIKHGLKIPVDAECFESFVERVKTWEQEYVKTFTEMQGGSNELTKMGAWGQKCTHGGDLLSLAGF